VLSGGILLPPGQSNEVNGRRVWTVDAATLRKTQHRQLFVNGQRAVRARTPNEEVLRIKSLPGYSGDFLRSPTQVFVFNKGDINPAWHDLQGSEIVALTRWQDNRLPVKEIDGASNTVSFDRPSLFALHSGDTPEVYWVENVLEALDSPGEWYFDRNARQIHYLPRDGEEPASAEFVTPRLERLLRAIGTPEQPVHDLRFENLAFAHAEWQIPADYSASLQAGIEVPGAIQFEYAERCTVGSCAIEHVGGYGIEVGVGCADLSLARNRLTDLGGGGIRIRHFFLLGDRRQWAVDGSRPTTQGQHAHWSPKPWRRRRGQRDQPWRAVVSERSWCVRRRQPRQPNRA